MERRYLFAAIGSLAVLTVCFSYFDIVRSFSDTYVWWDSLEHFLGGVTVGFFALFLLTLARSHQLTRSTVLMVLLVGVAWEMMEYTYGIGGSRYMSYAADTLKDIVLDCLGGYASVLIGRHLRHL